MRVFVIFELVIVLILLYLVLNILRFFFFRGVKGNWFGLSEKWIRDEEKTRKNGKGG